MASGVLRLFHKAKLMDCKSLNDLTSAKQPRITFPIALLFFLCSIILSALFDVDGLTAQTDSSSRRLRVNPETNTNPALRLERSNIDLPQVPQEEPFQVRIEPDNPKIRLGEELLLTATINFDDIPTEYDFRWPQNVISAAYPDNNVLMIDGFTRTGTFLVSVNVVMGYDPDRVISDRILIVVDSIDLEVNPVEVQVGQPVRLSTRFQSRDTNVRYRFFYGNNFPLSEWSFESESEFEYDRPGNYSVYAEIGKFDGDDPYSIFKTVTKGVIVKEQFAIKLEADKISTLVGEIIRFTAFPNTDRQDIFYEFILGETHLRPQREKSVEHSFNAPGNYTASVQLVTRRGEILAESSLLIKIVPPLEESNNNWIIYPIILAVFVLLGYSSYKWFFAPKVTLLPKKDLGKQALKDFNDITVDFEIRLSHNLSDAKYETKLANKNLVSSFRRIQ